eukprot:3793741-Amphidinium_carterae.1
MHKIFMPELMAFIVYDAWCLVFVGSLLLHCFVLTVFWQAASVSCVLKDCLVEVRFKRFSNFTVWEFGGVEAKITKCLS